VNIDAQCYYIITYHCI